MESERLPTVVWILFSIRNNSELVTAANQICVDIGHRQVIARIYTAWRDGSPQRAIAGG